jgi:hypothetical protein
MTDLKFISILDVCLTKFSNRENLFFKFNLKKIRLKPPYKKACDISDKTSGTKFAKHFFFATEKEAR